MSQNDEITTADETTAPPPAETVEKAVRGLVDIGRLWAAHGLGIGRSALETSAATLRTTATFLGELAQRFEPRTADDEA